MTIKLAVEMILSPFVFVNVVARVCSCRKDMKDIVCMVNLIVRCHLIGDE